MSDEGPETEARSHARADVEAIRTPNPRPSLLRALFSDRYREVYLKTYHLAFQEALYQRERALAQELERKSTTPARGSTPTDRQFQAGWSQGFNCQTAKPSKLKGDELAAFERGVSAGQRHREFQLAKKLHDAAVREER